MKRILTIILSLIFSVAMLSGCGGESKPAENGKTNEPKTEESTTESNTDKSIFGDAKDIKAISYSMVTTVDGKQLVKGKFWVKNNKLKIETTAEDMGTVFFYADGNKKEAYNYIPAEQMATKIDYSQAEAQAQNSPLDFTEQYSKDTAQYKVIGEESINGHKCKVIEVKEQEGIAKVWVSKEFGFPVKIESREDGKAMIIEFSDIKTENIPDSEFELPAGVQVMDTSEIMKNMPNMPQNPQ